MSVRPAVRGAGSAGGALALTLALALASAAPAPLAAEDLPPKFREAVDLFLAGDYKACQVAFGRAAAEAPRAGLAVRAAYGAACCAAVRNDVDGGFEAFSLALDNGFIDLERALTDPRLDTLRADARWITLISLVEERQQAHQKTLDPDLLRLYLEQQTERGGLGRDLPRGETPGRLDSAAAAAFVEHGLTRRKEAWELVEKGRVRVADDAFHAAALLVESDQPVQVQRASELAQLALTRDPDQLAARPLIATAADRIEMLAGKPQKFGTQLVEVGGRWQVYEVDPAVTDAERAEWGLPPLADAQARAAELNRQPSVQPGVQPAVPTPPTAGPPH